MDALDRKRDDAGAPRGRRAEQGQPLDIAERLKGILGDLALVGAHSVHAQRAQVIDSGSEPDHLGDRLRAGFELPGQVVISRALDADGPDHVPAGHERVHSLEQLTPAVQDSGAGRPEHLVPAEGVEVASQRAHVGSLVWRALRTVHQHRCAGCLGRRHHLLGRVDRPQGVAHLAKRHELRGALEELVELVEAQLSSLVDVHVLDRGSLLGGQDLPRHDVRVVLEEGEDEQVALLDMLASPRIRDQVDGLSGAARVDDLLGRGRVDELTDLRAGRLVVRGRLFGDVVGTPVDVRVELLEVLHHRPGHLAGPLRGVRRVEVGDARLEDWEILPDRRYIKRLDGQLSPGPRCRPRRPPRKPGRSWRESRRASPSPCR